MDFKKFSKVVNDTYKTFAQSNLFRTTLSGDELFAVYLQSFPEGTNPVYINRTEHDCSCCKNFIRSLGATVAMVDGKIQTVWSNYAEMAYPYNVVAKAMDDALKASAITGLYLTKERKYGAEKTTQTTAEGKQINWDHFYADVLPHHYRVNPEAEAGAWNTNYNTAKRAMSEITVDALDRVISLIGENMLYRGEEFLTAVQNFKNAKKAYDKDQEIYLLEGDNTNSWVAGFRSSSIGSLVTDLSLGVSLEEAVKMFESKVAPHNYKRPKQLITAQMVKAAMESLSKEGISDEDLQRRHATLADISVNNVLWASADHRKVASTSGSLTSELMAVAARQAKRKPIEGKEVGIDDFLANIAPQASQLEMMVENIHVGNFFSLLTGSDAKLFKWDNPFSWSYKGGATDSSLRQTVKERGGRVDGVFRFSHSWNHEGKRNTSLMDLHVFFPDHSGQKGQSNCHDNYGNGRRIGWNNRSDSVTGGVQDVDYTPAAPVGYIPVENITFPDLNKMKEGKYICRIHNWALRTPTTGGFHAEIEFGGVVYEYVYDKPLKNKEWVTVAEVTLKDGVFTIEHKIPTTKSSKTVWGIDTEVFTPVSAVMYSPNHWQEKGVGNRHYLFALQGCVADEQQRGIYNEYLSDKLEKHRRVFEVLGEKTKCPLTQDQVSGVGFSSTQSAKVNIRATIGGKQQLFTVVI